jgi:prepilin-type N-terminal cleavage/methylation domain-containing protein
MRRREEGFTMIEVMISMLVASFVTAMALVLINTDTQGSLASQRQAQLLSVAQQQIEQIRQMVKQSGFSSLAISGSNASSSYTPPPDPVFPHTSITDPKRDPVSPDDFIQGYTTSSASLLIMETYHDETSGTIAGTPTTGEQLLFDAANGKVQPMSTNVSVGGSATATVWRFVTQRTETCNTALSGSCTGDSRRVVVAVRLDNATSSQNIGPNTPIYMTTVVDNPVPSNAPSQGNGLRIGVSIS